MANNKTAIFSRLDLSTSIHLARDLEDNFNRYFEGIGYGYLSEDAFFEEEVPCDAIKQVGYISGWYFDFSQTSNSVHDLLDEGADTCPFTKLYKSNGEWDPIIFDVLEVDEFEIHENYLMAFHVLYIDPQFRGNNFAKYFFNETIKALHADTDVFALDVSPLQISGWGKKEDYDLEKFEGIDEVTSKKKLIKYYSKFGFTALPDSTIMVATAKRIYTALQQV